MQTAGRVFVSSLLLCVAVACGGSDPEVVAPTTGATATGAPASEAGDVSPFPSQAPGGLHLVVVGDFGTGDDDENEVSQAMLRWVDTNGASAFLTTGDNIYPAGESADFDEAWTEPYGWVAARGLPVVASLGNHDVMNDGGAAVQDLLAMPDRWYSKVIGDAEIFVLDANDPANGDQLQWLTQALQASSATWKIAVFHEPAYSCASHDGTPLVQELWVPLFESTGVDLVLNGHDHDYQRFVAPDGPTYVVTGGGGDSLYPLEPCPAGYPPRVAGNDQDHHFLAVTADLAGLRVQALGSNGVVIDDFTIPR
jgi:hypothetical protein